MNLRTDDIQGARPRIRHAPRNLVRDQRMYQNQQFNQYSDQGPYRQYYLNQVNLSESYHEKSPVMKNEYQMDPRVQTYANYQEKYRQGSGEFMRYEREHQQNLRKIAPQQQIRIKDAPVVNYEQYAPRQAYQEKNTPSNNPEFHYNQQQLAGEKGERSRRSSRDGLYEQRHSEQPLEHRLYNPQKPESRKSSQSQPKSAHEESKEMGAKQPNIFRGLGFNIITNTKFSYDMENNLKHSSSKWL